MGVRIQSQPGGRFTTLNTPLRMLIRYAYQVQGPELAGGEGWLDSERFDIAAKAEGNATQNEVRAMLQSLLADRFKLKVHRETREQPMYVLMLSRSDGKFGRQLRRSAVDCANVSADAPPRDANGRLACGSGLGPGAPSSPGRRMLGLRGSTMTEFANHLEPLVGRHVVDRTGVTGYFDMDFDFTLELQPPPPPPGVPDPFDRQAFQTIFSVLPEQLGLKLDSERGNVDVLVIDHAERPVPD
jgi:uncharacterized protein (TIGR03435 family)